MTTKPAVTPGGPIGRLFVGLVVGLVRWWSPRTRERVAGFVAWLAWTLRIRRAVALDNLAHAFPELPEPERRRIARGSYRTMALAALDAVTSDLLPDDDLARVVSIVDWKGLDAIAAAGRPVLVASAHFGSWELFAEVMSRRGHAFSAVVRPLAGAFNEWVVRNRQQAGVELILQRGGLQGMLKALARNRPVVQLIDQSLPAREALLVPFFGRPAATTPALSMAAIRSGAPVYLVLALREADGLRMFVEGPFPVPERAERSEALAAHATELNAVLERYIRRAPEQWLWLHRRWKLTDEQRQRLASSSASSKAASFT